MRLQGPSAEPLDGFAVGERVHVQYEGADGSLAVVVGTLTRVARSGLTIERDGANPISFTWPAVRSIGRA